MTGVRDEREGRAQYLLGRLLSDIYKDECAAELLRDAVDYLPELAAARVELGIAYCRLERYGEMLEAFREAIRRDEQAVRAAVRDDPAELEALRSLLYPDRAGPLPTTQERPTLERPSGVPAYVRETWALVRLGREYIGAGRDGEAIAALEAVLRLDDTYQYAMALLSLAYLLLKGDNKVGLTSMEGSVL
jgi:tetratricopeptide (TPR) repeat protein